MYLDGSGIPRQPLQAYVWASLAHVNDQTQAAVQLTPREIGLALVR